MNAKIKILTDEARKLTADERAELVDAIVETIHETDPDIEEAWIQESMRRLDELESGRAKAIDLADVPELQLTRLESK